MFKIFKSVPVYIKVSVDKIEITNLNTGQFAVKYPLKKFSSSRMLIADFNIAADLAVEVIKELGLSKRSLKAVIQQMKSFEPEICESEKRMLRDLAYTIGAQSVRIVEHIRPLVNDDALRIIKEKGGVN